MRGIGKKKDGRGKELIIIAGRRQPTMAKTKP